jgi:phosphate transport system substrate-binding protein
LNFTPAALAGIFLGKIKKWNDPAIASANTDIKLPAADIVVVHRSDGSGTSFVFTDYLSKVSPEWAAGPGAAAAVSWPVGLGGKGNEGLIGLVKQTPNSIGYTEMIYAIQNKLPMGAVQNAAGKFVKASPASVTEAAAGTPMPDDFRVSITNATGEGAYPISSFTWLLIPETIADAGKREVIVDFLKWMLGPGQEMAPGLEYAQLPAAVIAKEQAAIAQIK